MFRALSLLLLLLASVGSAAAETPDWRHAEEAVVEAVITGDTLRLGDGRELRLAAVRAPRPPLAYQRPDGWRREEAARAALEALAPPGEKLRFLEVEAGRDRHRRLLVQAKNHEGVWLQQRLLIDGALLLERLTDEVPPPLLSAEQEARLAGRGLWQDPAHAVVPADTAETAIGRFALVQGRVLAADAVRGLGYLNFGEDWREDFTIRVPRSVVRQLEAEGRTIEQFAGRQVIARGWVFYSGGPMIEVRELAEIVELTD